METSNFNGFRMFELLEEPQLIPDKFLKDIFGESTSILNPNYLLWRSKEKALLTFISSTLPPSILAVIVGCTSTIKVWKILENRFSSISRSHIMNLKGELHNLKKGVDTINLYLPKIKVMRDKLLSVGMIIDDEKLIHITIKGLPQEYNAFRSGIRTKSTQLSFDELLTMLNAKEESLNESLDVKDPIFVLLPQNLMEIVTINTIKEGAEGTITVEVEEEVEVRVINYLSIINSLTSNKTSPILLLLVQDQRGHLIKYVASLDI